MEIAKAIVFAGTGAHDLPWPSVRSVPKALVPLANRPILFHHLDAMRTAGVLETTIVVEPSNATAIQNAVGDGLDWNLTVRYAVCREGTGLRHVLQQVRELGGNEPIFVQRAGALLSDHIHPYMTAFASEHLDALALRLAPGDGQHGVDGGWLLSQRAAAMLAAEREVGADPVLDIRRAGGSVRVQEVDGCVPCLGSEEALLDANRRMLELLQASVDPVSVDDSQIQGTVVVHPTARVSRSLIRGPLIIGPDARIQDAYIGPYTSIGARVAIEGAEIEYSLVLADAQLMHLASRVEASIVGRGARVVRSFTLPRALRLSIGEGAEIALS
jgi:glucose-1-phosphate thymidylyltransferase